MLSRGLLLTRQPPHGSSVVFDLATPQDHQSLLTRQATTAVIRQYVRQSSKNLSRLPTSQECEICKVLTKRLSGKRGLTPSMGQHMLLSCMGYLMSMMRTHELNRINESDGIVC